MIIIRARVIQRSRQRLTWTTFSSLRIRGIHDSTISKSREMRKGRRLAFEFEDWSNREHTSNRSFLDPIVGQSTLDDDGAWNCQPFYSCSHALYCKTCLLWIGPPLLWMIELHRTPSFEECPSPSRKLSGLPITVKRALRWISARFFLFFFTNRKCFDPFEPR